MYACERSRSKLIRTCVRTHQLLPDLTSRLILMPPPPPPPVPALLALLRRCMSNKSRQVVQSEGLIHRSNPWTRTVQDRIGMRLRAAREHSFAKKDQASLAPVCGRIRPSSPFLHWWTIPTQYGVGTDALVQRSRSRYTLHGSAST